VLEIGEEMAEVEFVKEVCVFNVVCEVEDDKGDFDELDFKNNTPRMTTIMPNVPAIANNPLFRLLLFPGLGG
jgi:hypothetical protein